MKLAAYILAADPAWIDWSVPSYYDLVDRIIVSYDGDGLGWTGAPLQIEECLNRLRAIDVAYRTIAAEGGRAVFGKSSGGFGALHLVFDFSKDRLIWDTGHQIYPHKLITGRYHEFPTIRQKRKTCRYKMN